MTRGWQVSIDSVQRLQNFRGEDGNGPLSPVTQSCIDKLRSIKKVGTTSGTDDPINDPSQP